MYLVGSFVLVSLAGCGRGLFQAEREPWRAEAEVACLKSGAVREGPELVRIDPISGPGMCGAQFPLKVAAFGEASATFGYSDELRPPASIGNQPRWPVSQPPPAPAPYSDNALRQPNYGAPSNGPISLSAPGVAPREDEIELPAEGRPASRLMRAHRPIRRATVIRPLVRLLIRSHQLSPCHGSARREAIPLPP